MKYRPEVVFHLAGQPGVLYSFKNPKSYIVNNLIATKNIALLSKKYNIRKFIFASSSSVYGDQKYYPIRETFKVIPKNPYGKSKLNCEKYLASKFRKTKIDFAIFRFFTVYGPYGRPDMFIHKFLNNLKHKKNTKLYNNGLNYRDFTYIDDVVKILKLSLYKKLNGQIFNICRSNPIVTFELVNKILKLLKIKKFKIIKTGFMRGEMKKTHGCNQKLIKFFGKFNFTDIDKGLKETIKTFKKFSI